MSWYIEITEITGVLLADGWHTVQPKTFDVDFYAFSSDGDCIHDAGQSGVCASGFEFTDDTGHILSGPLTAVIAVRRNGHPAGALTDEQVDEILGPDNAPLPALPPDVHPGSLEAKALRAKTIADRKAERAAKAAARTR